MEEYYEEEEDYEEWERSGGVNHSLNESASVSDTQ